MYTQCPDCDTAFRVTAPDLQRASGRVVCAGCSREFNALERLTEDPPPAAERADEERAILESLNELTGPHEIRIEDTGVEWRVIEEGELADDRPPPAGESESGRDENSSIRWYIADLADESASEDNTSDESMQTERSAGSASPDPVIQAPLARSLDDQKTSSLQESLELQAPDGDAQRYDDNTPLPEDFIDEDEPGVPQRRAEDRIEPRSPEADEAQVDLGLSEPEDWMELLDEVGPPPDDAAIDNSRLDSPDETFAAERASEHDDAPADTDVRPISNDEFPVDDSYPSDIDTQFDLQAIELGIDLTGSRNLSLEHEAGEPDEPLRLETTEDRIEFCSESDLAKENAPRDEQPLPTVPQNVASEEPVVRAAAGEVEEWPGPPPEGTASRPAEEEEDAEERVREVAFEQELTEAYSITLDEEVDEAPDEAAQTGHFVPPATEEEMTINMLIDQDLIRLAEQQNVFTSTTARHKPDDVPQVETIIMEGEFVHSVLDGDPESSADSGGAAAVRKPSARATQAEPDDGDILLETWIKTRDRGGHRRTDPPSYGVMAGVAVLGLVLAAQVVHAYRDSLATYPIFDRTLGPVYRLLGEPVVPGWNIKEWHFEATSGSTGDTDEVLTISSRIVNGSAKPLPYPLLHVSLTDRWEEIIGSKVLEPAEYLAGSANPATLLGPGEKFTAVIRVEAPAPEATGFKLNVCYPDTGDRVRCATEDFR